MKTLIIGLLLSVNVYANTNSYENMMLDCLDYYHSPKTQEQINACHIQVRESLLADASNQQQFLACIDYGHSEVSAEKEIACLKELN